MPPGSEMGFPERHWHLADQVLPDITSQPLHKASGLRLLIRNQRSNHPTELGELVGIRIDLPVPLLKTQETLLHIIPRILREELLVKL